MGLDILDQFRTVSNKLKKRFLRKPNVTEAADEFSALAVRCGQENVQMHPYAALCWIAAARCEGSLSNTVTERSCLVQAARQYFIAAENDEKILSAIDDEQIQAGLSCYLQALIKAVKISEESSVVDGGATSDETSDLSNHHHQFIAGVNLEIFDCLQRLQKDFDGLEEFLQNALQSTSGSKVFTATTWHVLDLLMTHFMHKEDYQCALETCHQLKKSLNELETVSDNGIRTEMLLKCEINAVLLILILRPNVKLYPQWAEFLEKYAWGDTNHVTLQECHMNKTLYLALQSLVLTTQSLDRNSLVDLENQLWSHFSKEQRKLFRTLVQIYHH